MVEMLFKDLYKIEVPLPNNPLKNLNSYFIKGTHRNLLVDTGFNTDVCFDALKKGLNEINADMHDTDIFLTHMHTDHSGMGARIASKESKIYISKKDEKYLRAFSDKEFWEKLVALYQTTGFTKIEIEENIIGNPMRAFSPPQDAEYTSVENGFEIDLNNYHFQAIETPGHTPGHMCLYDKEHKILLCGDHIIFNITPNITFWPGVENSLGNYLNSLKETRKLDVEAALSAHRSPIGNCRSRIDELILHHKNRLTEVHGIVSSFPGSTAYVIASKMKWSTRVNNWSEFPPIQKWFAVGETISHLDYLLCENVIMKTLRDGKLVYDTILPC